MLRTYLEQHWNLSDVTITALHGGMGSATWIVELGDHRWVAKRVAGHAGTQFAGGLELARRLEAFGIPAGAPVAARDGRLAVDVGDGWLALLSWVPGDPLTGRSTAERQLIGNTLAEVHRALSACSTNGANRFHWVDPDATYLSLRPGCARLSLRRSTASTPPIRAACPGACCTPIPLPTRSGSIR